MKSFFVKVEILTCCLLIFICKVYGQEYFLAEDKPIKSATVVKSYHFLYDFQDTLTVFLMDSVETFYNADSTIVKSTTNYYHGRTPNISLTYYRKDKKDSITKWYVGDELTDIYETRFDSLDRMIYYALKEFPSNSVGGFENIYEYHDSITSSGKITIKSVYRINEGQKEFSFRVLSFYDMNNRLIKTRSESKVNDPWAQTITYEYDKYGNLIDGEVYTAGVERKLFPPKESSKCMHGEEMQFSASDYKEVVALIKVMLKENQKILTNDRCVNLVYDYLSSNKDTILSIRKIPPYWEAGRNVTFTRIIRP